MVLHRPVEPARETGKVRLVLDLSDYGVCQALTNPKEFQLVSNYFSVGVMVRETQFRRVLPALQTAIAVSLGGWGLWLRSSILSRPFLGSTGWNSTAVFHVWPWPFKFAAILNMPAFLAGGLLSWPLDYFRPGLPEWVSALPVLLLIPLLWYWVGSSGQNQ